MEVKPPDDTPRTGDCLRVTASVARPLTLDERIARDVERLIAANPDLADSRDEIAELVRERLAPMHLPARDAMRKVVATDARIIVGNQSAAFEIGDVAAKRAVDREANDAEHR